MEREKKKTYLTFKHCKLGAGVDLSSTVSGGALINGFVSVCAQWLDPQYGARTIIKLNHLGEPRQSERARTLFFKGLFFFFFLLQDINKAH